MSAPPGVAQLRAILLRGDSTWMDRAACAGKPAALFFERECAQEALRICRSCPVIKQCAAWRDPGTEGVWGGHAHYRPRGAPAGTTTSTTTKPHGASATSAGKPGKHTPCGPTCSTASPASAPTACANLPLAGDL
ncbi:MAG: WhiB family transcriptional regulator [Actinomycetia bacterium]|nr:WhiB family transcriptional regulator [Actinomycetes bacterium]